MPFGLNFTTRNASHLITTAVILFLAIISGSSTWAVVKQELNGEEILRVTYGLSNCRDGTSTFDCVLANGNGFGGTQVAMIVLSILILLAAVTFEIGRGKLPQLGKFAHYRDHVFIGSSAVACLFFLIAFAHGANVLPIGSVELAGGIEQRGQAGAGLAFAVICWLLEFVAIGVYWFIAKRAGDFTNEGPAPMENATAETGTGTTPPPPREGEFGVPIPPQQ